MSICSWLYDAGDRARIETYDLDTNCNILYAFLGYSGIFDVSFGKTSCTTLLVTLAVNPLSNVTWKMEGGLSDYQRLPV